MIYLIDRGDNMDIKKMIEAQKELDGAYWRKNKINWERIKNNY